MRKRPGNSGGDVRRLVRSLVRIGIRIPVCFAGCAKRLQAQQERAQQRNGAREVMRQREGILLIDGIARHPGGGREMCSPVNPAALGRCAGHCDVRIRKEIVVPVSQSTFCIFVFRLSSLRTYLQLLVALAQQLEGVFVTAEPHVQPMFFDAAGRAAARRALSAQSPAELIYRDVISALVLGSGEFKCRSDRCAAAAYDRDFYGPSGSQLPLPPFRCSCTRSRRCLPQAFCGVYVTYFFHAEKALSFVRRPLPPQSGQMSGGVVQAPVRPYTVVGAG